MWFTEILSHLTRWWDISDSFFVVNNKTSYRARWIFEQTPKDQKWEKLEKKNC